MRKPRISPVSTAALVSLVLLTAVPVWAQEQEPEPPWTWINREGQPRTREDLTRVLANHLQRVESAGRAARAGGDFVEALLREATPGQSANLIAWR